jgi:predicted enzyme related to lactoylglutathione lyase
MSAQLVHFEIPTPDLSKAQAFYTKLFDWQLEPYGESYHFIPGQPSGGIFPSEGGATGAPLAVYFGVDDIEAAVAQVESLGGHAEPVRDMPGIGKEAVCQDDQGTTFRLFQAATGSTT